MAIDRGVAPQQKAKLVANSFMNFWNIIQLHNIFLYSWFSRRIERNANKQKNGGIAEIKSEIVK